MLPLTSYAWGSPGRYIQGAGELDRLAIHTEKFGKRAFAVIDEFFYKSFTKRLDTLYKDAGGAFLSFLYQTEITKELIEKASDEASGFSPDVIIGIGGGKALDTAKAVASRLSLPLVIIPTSASTDAPTSAMSIIYNDAHEHDDVYYYIKNPDLVLVDSQIIADAPVRFLVSGMGDALATVLKGAQVSAPISPTISVENPALTCAPGLPPPLPRSVIVPSANLASGLRLPMNFMLLRMLWMQSSRQTL